MLKALKSKNTVSILWGHGTDIFACLLLQDSRERGLATPDTTNVVISPDTTFGQWKVLRPNLKSKNVDHRPDSYVGMADTVGERKHEGNYQLCPVLGSASYEPWANWSLLSSILWSCKKSTSIFLFSRWFNFLMQQNRRTTRADRDSVFFYSKLKNDRKNEIKGINRDTDAAVQ